MTRFQWVSCQIDELKSLQIARPKDIEDVLKSMPPTLDECYMRILQSVNSRFQTEVVKALQWISLSFVPLSVKEVNEACIIDLTELPAIKEENQFTGDGITTCLSSFVTRTEDEKPRLSLSHFSVKEFLKSSTIQDSAYSRYGFREGVAHAFIAESCIAYIYYYSSSPMKLGIGNDLKYFPLLFYACRHWFEHLRLATEEEQERLAPLVMKFLLTSWNVYYNALRVYNPLLPMRSFPCSVHTLASPLGWAATLGMESLVKRLLNENSTEIDAIQDIECVAHGHGLATGSSHSSFSERCSNSICSTLSGSFIMRIGTRGTALMRAVAYDHVNIARLLIENGANLRHMEQGNAMNLNSVLSIACYQGNDKMVRMLLGYGADPNEICGGLPALEFAVKSKSLDVCKTLLDNGAYVDGSDLTQKPPLVHAALWGNLDICRLLLDRGADINWTSKDDPNGPSDILSIAAINEYVELVELFLSRGAHMSSQVLFWSLCEPYMIDHEIRNKRMGTLTRKKVYELLILHGANLNPDCKKVYNTPLAVVISLKWYDIAELMLSKGARVDPDNPSCLTAGNVLIAASHSVTITRRILDTGVDANAPGAFVKPFDTDLFPVKWFSNALQAAAFHHNRGVVELLLERNADPRLTSPPYGSALYAVFGRIASDRYVSKSYFVKSRKICDMLLAKGANWDRKYGPDDEELMAECMFGYSGLIEWEKGNIPLNTYFEHAERELLWIQVTD